MTVPSAEFGMRSYRQFAFYQKLRTPNSAFRTRTYLIISLFSINPLTNHPSSSVTTNVPAGPR